MSDNILIEELTLIPIGKDTKEIGIKPIRITVDGRSLPLYFDAHDIAEIKSAAEQANRAKGNSGEA